jgi:hypothetical protein
MFAVTAAASFGSRRRLVLGNVLGCWPSPWAVGLVVRFWGIIFGSDVA